MASMHEVAKDAALSLCQFAGVSIYVSPWGRSEYVHLECGLLVRVSDHACNPRQNQIDLSTLHDLAEAEMRIAAAIIAQRRAIRKAQWIKQQQKRHIEEICSPLAEKIIMFLMWAGEHPLTSAQEERWERATGGTAAAMASALRGRNMINQHRKPKPHEIVGRKISKIETGPDKDLRRRMDALIKDFFDGWKSATEK